MGTHYFSTRPEVASRPKQIRARLRGREWTFVTDRGVFARGGVDAGTRLLVEAIRIAPADHIMDIGCGYGPVGLVAASLAFHGQAVLIDVNARAVGLAAQNAQLNGLVNVEVLQGDGCGPVGGRIFDAAVTNPPIRAGKATLRRLVRDIWQHLRPGGRFYFVARTAQGAKALARDVAEVFGAVRELERQSGYRVYEAVKETASSEQRAGNKE